MKKILSDSALTLAIGLSSGITITRIIDGGNVLGAIAAGVAIGTVLGVMLKLFLAKWKLY